VLDAKPVASPERGKLGAEDSDAALLGRHDSGEQREQRALAAAARTEQEHTLARVDAEAFDVEARRGRPRPPVQQGRDFDQSALGHPLS